MNQNGFSLTSVLVSVGILGILATGFASMMSHSMTSTHYMEDKLSSVEFRRDIATFLMNPNDCAASLGGLRIRQSQKVTQIKNASESISFQVNSPIEPMGNVILNGITLENLDVPNAPNSQGWMSLQFALGRRKNAGGPKHFQPFQIRLNVVTGPNSRIEKCSVMNDTGSGLVEGQMPCVANTKVEIYSSRGKGGSLQSSSNSQSDPKIFRHGETDIVIQRTETHLVCGAGTTSVYYDYYNCENGEMTKTRQKLVETRPAGGAGNCDGQRGD